jgi:hypothetical protein
VVPRDGNTSSGEPPGWILKCKGKPIRTWHPATPGTLEAFVVIFSRPRMGRL